MGQWGMLKCTECGLAWIWHACSYAMRVIVAWHSNGLGEGEGRGQGGEILGGRAVGRWMGHSVC